MKRILVVDDDRAVRLGLRKFLEAHGYEVSDAGTVRAAESSFRAQPPDLALLDQTLADGSGLELMATLRAIDSAVPVIILTGNGSIALAVRAVKDGARNFLTKPVDLPALLVLIQREVDNSRTQRQQAVSALRADRDSIDPFLGQSAAIRSLADKAQRLLESDATILLQGPTGSGKGVLARWLHQHGPRAEESFVDLNCAGFSREFLESELFGHEKGAYTGAASQKIGLLELAHRGTAFLDEIGDLDPALQPRLLKVLEERRFRRLGEVRDRAVDVRVIAATNRNLRDLSRSGQFREDLYFRIGTLALTLPSLAERSEDIPLLAQTIFNEQRRALGRTGAELGADAIAELQAYSWPGNLRELRNVLERALLLAKAQVIRGSDLALEQRSEASRSQDLADLTLGEVERRQIQLAMEKEEGRVQDAARRLGIPRSTLYQRLKTLGLLPLPGRS